jgi:hypothetical protein
MDERDADRMAEKPKDARRVAGGTRESKGWERQASAAETALHPVAAMEEAPDKSQKDDRTWDRAGKSPDFRQQRAGAVRPPAYSIPALSILLIVVFVRRNRRGEIRNESRSG